MANTEAGASGRALFRSAMSRFFSVITTRVRGDVRGMTANAFMSGTLDPPLCVISVATTAPMNALLVAAMCAFCRAPEGQI